MSDLRVDALGLVAVGGTALLSAAVAVTERRLRAVPITAVVVAVAVMAAGAVTRHRGEGAAALAVMVAAAVVAEVALGSIRRARTAGVVAAAVGAVAVAVAGALEPDAAALLAVVGAGLVVGVVVTTGRVGIVAVPAVVLALAEHLADASSSAADRAGVAAAVLGVAAAVVPSRLVASRWRPRPVAFSGGRGAVFAFAVAYVVVAQAPAELRSAGLLLCGGAVVAAASSHRFGLVALVPGLAAAVEALGAADRPVHAVAGVAVLGIVMAAWRAGADRPLGGDDPDEFDSAQPRTRPASPLSREFEAREHWALPLALFVAVVPTWGWSGADVGAGYNRAVAAAVASAAIAGIIFIGRLRRVRPASSPRGARR